jgi:hypothetical protein
MHLVAIDILFQIRLVEPHGTAQLHEWNSPLPHPTVKRRWRDRQKAGRFGVYSPMTINGAQKKGLVEPLAYTASRASASATLFFLLSKMPL